MGADRLPWENHVREDSTEFYYLKGLSYYKQLMTVPQAKISKDEEIEAMMCREKAILCLKKAIDSTSEWEQFIIKIRAQLLLVKLYGAEWEKEDREAHFYGAVELARQHLWEDFQNTPHGKEIMDTYLSNIDTTFKNVCRGKSSGPVVQVLHSVIALESMNRAQKQQLEEKQLEEKLLKEEENIRDYIKGNPTSSQVIEKLESIYGSIRLLIVSENSDETLIDHPLDKSKIEALEEESGNVRHATVDVFDKPRKYAVTVDRRTGHSVHQFEEYRLTNIINPLVDYCIRRKERELFIDASENTKEIGLMENKMRAWPEGNDYGAFVTSVIERCVDPMEFHESREDRGYTDNFLKALDICRSLALGSEDLPQEIDRILWGEIKRRVLHMVKTMLLSRNETMNGSGYPFGLSKRNIPLEWRMYSIIRAYEALSCVKNPDEVVKIMKKWAQCGHFDSEILRVFLEGLGDGATFPKLAERADGTSVASPYRKARYVSSMQLWSNLLKITRDIGQFTYIGRIADIGTDVKDLMFRRANESSVRLLKEADMRKLFIITRHGEAESDDPDGEWLGNENELLTQAWEASSYQKWTLLRDQHLRIFTTPLIRGRQTTAIICQGVRHCVQSIIPMRDNSAHTISSCADCPAIIPEETITNPRKNMQNGRYNSLLQKILADHNMKWMGEFLVRLISSPEESTDLLVTHRDSAKQLIIWLNNILVKDRISSKKIVVDNNMVHEFLVRWGKLMSKRDKSKGLIFSTIAWKAVVYELNILTRDVFWAPFYDLTGRTGLIALHDRFLDFIDRKRESDPDGLSVFIERIKWSPDMKYIYPILKKEGMVG